MKTGNGCAVCHENETFHATHWELIFLMRNLLSKWYRYSMSSTVGSRFAYSMTVKKCKCLVKPCSWHGKTQLLWTNTWKSRNKAKFRCLHSFVTHVTGIKKQSMSRPFPMNNHQYQHWVNLKAYCLRFSPSLSWLGYGYYNQIINQQYPYHYDTS